MLPVHFGNRCHLIGSCGSTPEIGGDDVVARALVGSLGVVVIEPDTVDVGQLAGDGLFSLVEFQSTEEIPRSYPDGVRELAAGGA